MLVLPPVHVWPVSHYNRRTDLLLEPFAEATAVPHTEAQIAELATAQGSTVEAVASSIMAEYRWPIFRNDLYQVQLRWDPATMALRRVSPGTMQEMPDIVHLSIKLISKEPCHDWRHFQEIKSRLIGPEFEAMELYPAESRVVDTANQYHLWAFGDVSLLKQFGFTAGNRSYATGVGGSKQRGLGQ